MRAGEQISAYVALGSNLGDRAQHLARARAELAASEVVEVVAASRIYETEPVGPPQGMYLNAVVELRTALEPGELLELLQSIERAHGRVRGPTTRLGPRTLDLDLLLYSDECIDEPGLVVPHPRLHERGFVLEPLAELAAGKTHPRLGGTIAQYRDSRRDPAAVRLWCGHQEQHD